MPKGQQLKLQGMSRAAEKHAVTLANVKQIALLTGKYSSEVTIEDVRSEWELLGNRWDLGNAAGAVFDSQRWECVGYTTAKLAEAHGRVIRVWRLR